MNQLTPEDDLTPEESAAFAAMPREVIGHDQLAEERAVQAWRKATLVSRPGWRRGTRFPIVAVGIAAALVIFAAGAFFGRQLAVREVRSASPSIQVQQTGSAYVAALVRLSSASDPERSPGLEAGATTLRAAASSLAQINPSDPIALRIRTSLDNDSHATRDRSVIWF